MKNLEPRKGFVNRHTDGLPAYECIIKIIVNDVDGESIHLCQWNPFNIQNYAMGDYPTKGYCGTAKVIAGDHTGIGFNVWNQNDTDFVYYSKVEFTKKEKTTDPKEVVEIPKLEDLFKKNTPFAVIQFFEYLRGLSSQTYKKYEMFYLNSKKEPCFKELTEDEILFVKSNLSQIKLIIKNDSGRVYEFCKFREYKELNEVKPKRKY